MKNILMGALAALVLAGCAVKPTADELANADYGTYPTQYKEIIQSYMNRHLKDPESARYDWLHSPQRAWNGMGGAKFGHAVCLYVNARNSFGGYTGARPHYFLIRNDAVIATQHGDGKYGDAMVQGLCQHFTKM